MEITESALTAQYQRAGSAWPFVHQAGLARGLPRMLLFAAGSPETNLTNDVGCTSCSGSPSLQWCPAGNPGLVRPRPGPGVTRQERRRRSRGPEENRRGFLPDLGADRPGRADRR